MSYFLNTNCQVAAKTVTIISESTKMTGVGNAA